MERTFRIFQFVLYFFLSYILINMSFFENIVTLKIRISLKPVLGANTASQTTMWGRGGGVGRGRWVSMQPCKLQL